MENRRRAVKKALLFNIILVGASGLGKSTFINTLCRRVIVPPRKYDDPALILQSGTLSFVPYTVELDDDGVKTMLTVVDTPGFGDSLDNSAKFDSILQYIERQYDDVLGEESKIRRNPRTTDARLHALLYFISPTGHSLSELDIELMSRLGRRINILPLVAKSDTMTRAELAEFKRRVMNDIKAHNIKIFNFPCEEDDEEQTVQENEELRQLLPFAIVGGTSSLQKPQKALPARLGSAGASKKTVAASSSPDVGAADDSISASGMTRVYPWGTVDADNVEHSDNERLRYLLLTSHIHDLRDITVSVLYETYRSEKLSKLEGLAERLAVLTTDGSTASLPQNTSLANIPSTAKSQE